MRKPPMNLSNENSQATAYCRSNFAAKIGFEAAEDFFITLLIITRTPKKMRDFLGLGWEAKPPFPQTGVGRNKRLRVPILLDLLTVPIECSKNAAQSRFDPTIRKRRQNAGRASLPGTGPGEHGTKL
jgi:hypothetical protein